MSFDLPDPGSEAMVDLLMRITGDVAHATGPFGEPEQALVEAGRQDADWKAHAEPEEGNWSYVVVPLWSPEA